MGPNVKWDEERLELARRGNSEAFEQLYDRHRDWVYRLAWRFTGNQADACDVVQETFLYLLKKLPRLRLTASLRTFLYPAVKHLSLNVHRRRASVANAATWIGPAVSVPREGSRSELAAALAALHHDQREVVLMRFADDMTIEEIAVALNVPPGTVKSRLHRALELLRRDGRTRDYFLG